MASEKVRELADKIGGMDPKAAGMLGDALMRALGLRVYVAPAVVKPATPPPVEQTEFRVVLSGFEATSKLTVIREVRERFGYGLVESKKLVEGSAVVPVTLREEMSVSDAEVLVAAFKAAGARVEMV